jgi:hypothetical protein
LVRPGGVGGRDVQVNARMRVEKRCMSFVLWAARLSTLT